VATLLTYYYGIPTTEAEALELAEGFMRGMGLEPEQGINAMVLKEVLEAKGNKSTCGLPWVVLSHPREVRGNRGAWGQPWAQDLTVAGGFTITVVAIQKQGR